MADNRYKLNIGKYRGWDIHNVFDADISYCRWLLSKDHLLDKDSDIRKYLEEKLKDHGDSYIMTFGRYKNKSLKWIKQYDSEYLGWLKKNEYVQANMTKLKEELATL